MRGAAPDSTPKPVPFHNQVGPHVFLGAHGQACALQTSAAPHPAHPAASTARPAELGGAPSSTLRLTSSSAGLATGLPGSLPALLILGFQDGKLNTFAL